MHRIGEQDVKHHGAHHHRYPCDSALDHIHQWVILVLRHSSLNIQRHDYTSQGEPHRDVKKKPFLIEVGLFLVVFVHDVYVKTLPATIYWRKYKICPIYAHQILTEAAGPMSSHARKVLATKLSVACRQSYLNRISVSTASPSRQRCCDDKDDLSLHRMLATCKSPKRKKHMLSSTMAAMTYCGDPPSEHFTA